MGNVRYDIEYRGEEVGNVKVPWEHGDHVSVEDYEDLTKQLRQVDSIIDENYGNATTMHLKLVAWKKARATPPQEDV